jgi:hypothetical protein
MYRHHTFVQNWDRRQWDEAIEDNTTASHKVSEVYISFYFRCQMHQEHRVVMPLASFPLYLQGLMTQMMLPLDFAHFGKSEVNLEDQVVTWQYLLRQFHSIRMTSEIPISHLHSVTLHFQLEALVLTVSQQPFLEVAEAPDREKSLRRMETLHSSVNHWLRLTCPSEEGIWAATGQEVAMSCFG